MSEFKPMETTTSDYTVKRLHLADIMREDRYEISLAGDVVAIVDYSKAMAFMLGKVTPSQLANIDEQHQEIST